MSQPPSANEKPIFRRSAIGDGEPPVPFEGDLFGRMELANRITGYLNRLPDGAVISIDAPWGDGKTWFGRNWCADLEAKGFRTAYVDCFANDYVADPFAMLAREFVNLANEHSLSSASQLLEYASKVGAALLPAAVKVLFNTTVRVATGIADASDHLREGIEAIQDKAANGVEAFVKKTIEQYAQEKSSVEGLQQCLGDLARANESDTSAPKPIVVFVDELDRCRPDFAVRTLERIKHFFDVPGIVFILLMNREQMTAAIEGQYGTSKFDADRYLGKFIHLSLSLPKRLSADFQDVNDCQTYLESELTRYGFPLSERRDDFATTFGIFASHFKFSLRDCERAVGLFSIAQPLDKSMAFAAWPIALKLARPELFRDLLVHRREAHEKAGELAVALGQSLPNTSYVTTLFQTLHSHGAGHFNGAVDQETQGTLSSLGYRNPKSYLTSLFSRLTFRRSPDAFARNFPVAGRSRLARYFQVDETLGLLLPLTHKLLGTAVVVDRVL